MTRQQGAAHAISVRVIEAAVGLAIDGKMTAEKVIEYGCMTPECLTVETLLLVARDMGVRPDVLLLGRPALVAA